MIGKKIGRGANSVDQKIRRLVKKGTVPENPNKRGYVEKDPDKRKEALFAVVDELRNFGDYE